MGLFSGGGGSDTCFVRAQRGMGVALFGGGVMWPCQVHVHLWCIRFVTNCQCVPGFTQVVWSDTCFICKEHSSTQLRVLVDHYSLVRVMVLDRHSPVP